METQQRRLRHAGVPGRCFWWHPGADPVSLRRRSGFSGIESRSHRDCHTRRDWTAAFARPASERSAAEPPATMKRTFRNTALILLLAASSLCGAEAEKAGSRSEYDSFRIVTERN